MSAKIAKLADSSADETTASDERSSASSSSSSDGPVKDEKERLPYVWTTRKWPRIFFLDIDTFIHFGYKQRLEPEDLFDEKTVNTESLYSYFEPAWEAEQVKEKPFLLRSLIAGNYPVLIITAFLYGASQAAQLAGPLILQQIVQGLAYQPVLLLHRSLYCSCDPGNL
eukprot:gene13601-19474_t